MILIDTKTNKEISIGDKVTNFHGEEGILTGVEPPEHNGTTGHVRVQLDRYKGNDSSRWYPGVIGARFSRGFLPDGTAMSAWDETA